MIQRDETHSTLSCEQTRLTVVHFRVRNAPQCVQLLIAFASLNRVGFSLALHSFFDDSASVCFSDRSTSLQKKQDTITLMFAYAAFGQHTWHYHFPLLHPCISRFSPSLLQFTSKLQQLESAANKSFLCFNFRNIIQSLLVKVPKRHWPEFLAGNYNTDEKKYGLKKAKQIHLQEWIAIVQQKMISNQFLENIPEKDIVTLSVPLKIQIKSLF